MRILAGLVGAGAALALMAVLIVAGGANPFAKPFKVKSGAVTYEMSRPGMVKTTQTIVWDDWGDRLAQDFEQVARIDGKQRVVRFGAIVTPKETYGLRYDGQTVTLLPEGDTMIRAAMAGLSARELAVRRTHLARRTKSAGDDMVAGIWCNSRIEPRQVEICAYKNIPVRVVLQTRAGEVRLTATKAEFNTPIDPARFAPPAGMTLTALPEARKKS